MTGPSADPLRLQPGIRRNLQHGPAWIRYAFRSVLKPVSSLENPNESGYTNSGHANSGTNLAILIAIFLDREVVLEELQLNRCSEV